MGQLEELHRLAAEGDPDAKFALLEALEVLDHSFTLVSAERLCARVRWIARHSARLECLKLPDGSPWDFEVILTTPLHQPEGEQDVAKAKATHGDFPEVLCEMVEAASKRFTLP